VPANQNRLTINGNNINKKEPAETEYWKWSMSTFGPGTSITGITLKSRQ
jgi:hypothetical protein